MDTNAKLMDQWRDGNRYAKASLLLLKQRLRPVLAGRAKRLSPTGEAKAEQLDDVIYHTQAAALALQEHFEADREKLTANDRLALAQLVVESEQINERWTSLMRKAAAALGRE